MNKPELDGDKIKGGLKRAMWLFMALLFVVTGLGVGVYAFWQSTHPASDSTTNTAAQTSGVKCSNNPNIQFNVASTGATKIAGTKLSDFTPTNNINALSCIDVKVGSSGQAVQSSSSITANYTGAIAKTGVIFQSSLDNGGQPFTTALSGVIPGWQEGLIGMRAGGERRLLIPAALAYGATPPSGAGIPANADLVFDITVLVVQ
jgi:FKBP-type peptidyl-prolyl cis-trans isomerase